MNLRRLRYFLGVAAEGSVSRGARNYGIAQPALTRQMQLLETEIGAQLFERSSRGLRLTDTGQFIKDAIELPLSEIETALNSARSFSTHVRASLTIGMPPAIAEVFGERLIVRLHAELPNIALRIVEADSRRLAFDLSRRLIDTAVLVAVVPEQRVSRVQVLTEPFLLVGAAGSDVAGLPSVRFKDLANWPLILPPAATGMRIDLERAAEAAGIKLSAALEVESFDLTKRLLARRIGYAVLPPRAFVSEAAQGDLIGIPIVEPALSQSVMWAVKPDWRLPRTLYNELERVVFEEWHDVVASGKWQADWVFDINVLSIPFRPKSSRAS